MSTDRQGGRIIVECDCCPETIESERGQSWEEFWEQAKRDGWKSKMVAGEWMHGCPRHKV